MQPVKMKRHLPHVINQHGPDARCGFCRTAIHWDVIGDAWVHNLSPEQLDALADLRSGRLIAMLRGDTD